MLGSLLTKETEDLDNIIKKSLEKTGALKETDLAKYIPHGDTSLSKELFMHFKARNKNMLAVLMKENILDKEPLIYTSNNTSSPITPTHLQPHIEEVIEKAMIKLNVEKESELCQYLPDGNKRLHHFTYAKKKKTNPSEIASLIQANILDKDPKRLDRTYHHRQSTSSEIIKTKEFSSDDTSNSLQLVIGQAMKRKKLGIKKESDLCWYLPGNQGGYLYYSTFRSLKKNHPQKLEELIQDHIVRPKKPKKFPPNPRKPASTFNEEETINSQPPKIESLQQQLSELFQEIRSIKASYMNSRSSEEVHDPSIPTAPKNRTNDSLTSQYLRTIQNQLIKRIRQKEVDFELWDAFVELIEQSQNYLL